MFQALKKIDPVVLGILCAIASSLCFAFISVFVKVAGQTHDVFEITFWRSVIMVSFVGSFLVYTGKAGNILKADWKKQLLRGTSGLIAMLFIFYAFTLLPLAEAQTLIFANPLIIVILSWILLKEKVGPHRIVATIIGFLGIILVLRPEAISSVFGGAIALAGAFFYATTMISLRWMGKSEDTLITIFWFSSIAMLMTALTLPFSWSIPTLESGFYLLVVGVLALINQIFITKSYFFAPASKIAPIGYLNLLWAVIFDAMIWGYLPSIYIFIGATIIIGSNIYILWQEQRKKKPKEIPAGIDPL